MQKKSAPKLIRLRGVRHNNLKNFDLDLPLGKLIVITGLSGSGKSSLAFDTLFAEGQRRYVETFSPYARQFLDRMDKPQVDSIEGIPPAIAIEQRNSVKSTRSTVGTMTEICDYAKLLWSHLAQLHCKNCGERVRKDSPQLVWESLLAEDAKRRAAAPSNNPTPHEPERRLAAGFRICESQKPVTDRRSSKLVQGFKAQTFGLENSHPGGQDEFLITFQIALSEKLSLEESLALISKQGYQRLLIDGEIRRIEESLDALQDSKPESLCVVQDRLKLSNNNRKRFVEACEQAYHFGKGKLAVRFLSNEGSKLKIQNSKLFSNRFHCARCDIEYREATPALFSFNHPVGACPKCRGFGRTIAIDYNLAIPDRTRTLGEGAVRPWQSGTGADSQKDLLKFCKLRKVPTNVPFRDLPREVQDWVIEGDPGYGKDAAHEWPRAWYGVKGYFRWLESKAYKMHVRVLLSRYRAYELCADCGGTRFQPEPLGFTISDLRFTSETGKRPSIVNPKSEMSIAGFYELSIHEALQFVERIYSERKSSKPSDPLTLALNEVRSRLNFLDEVGLGYLTLDRPTKTLSGGETERVNLTTCLGSGLVNTLFVLDEPSVGLHPRDTDRLIQIVKRLRDAGNTLVVVEHEASMMRSADQIVDLGPGHGESGGHLVFQGTFNEILKSKDSLTGQYLCGKKKIDPPARREITAQTPRLGIAKATAHNLQNLAVQIPLGRLVCISGVSGSGKTTLVREVLLPSLEAHLKNQLKEVAEDETTDDDTNQDSRTTSPEAELKGWENLGRVVLVDQSPLGKTPRSNPAVYIGAFEEIRELFAQTEPARQRGLNASAFSFNSAQGQCEKCRGAGFEKIEMQFLSDVFIRCPECNGRRYRPHILEIKLSSTFQVQSSKLLPRSTLTSEPSASAWSIADLLEATVDESIDFLAAFPESRAAKRAGDRLRLLQEVGLGYLRLGQPINTLSGGESQRLKLVSFLAEAENSQTRNSDAKPTLFIFDEPTTGLHFDDVRVLLKVFHRLVEAGHSVVVIEHNLDVIGSADWIIDLGPEAGIDGGKVVVEGSPDFVTANGTSHTARALREFRK